FERATWHHLDQEVVLNQPGQSDGRIRVWVDGEKVLDKGGLIFRTTENLKIEGILFSTFFGGGDSSWATPKDVYADFADFSVFSVKRHRDRHSS
ncbi:MAG: polysaccharide lyase, partial [Cyanobacteriota bacterium]